MNAGTLLRILASLTALLETQGILTASGEFDDTKLNDLGEILALTAGVEAILVAHGVAIPQRVDALVKLLPLLGVLAGK